jgi:hypothetical protein
MSAKDRQRSQTGDLTLVVLLPREGDRWKMHDATLHFQSGLLDRLTVEGAGVPYDQGPLGITVSLNILKDSQYRDGRVFGTIEYATWQDGRLVATAVMAQDAEIIP